MATTGECNRSTALDPLVHRLIQEIDKQQISREQVSIDAGLGKDTIGSWARGQRTPNIGNLRAALQVVGVEIGVLGTVVCGMAR